MDPQYFLIAFTLTIWAVPIPFVGMLAGVFVYKSGKGWAALWVTLALQLLFAAIFPEVYFHKVSLPAEAAVGAWAIMIVATGLFGLVAYPFVFFIVHGKSRQRLLAGGLTVVALLVSVQLSHAPVAKRYGLDLNVDLYGKIVDLEGRPVTHAVVHLDYCTRYETNPVYTDHNGIFHVRADCPQQLVVTRIDGDTGGKPCLTRTESSLSILGGVVKFASLEQHRKAPREPHWGAHGRDNPYLLTCIWEPARNRKELRSYFRNLVADGRIYTAEIRGSRHPKLTLYEDGRRGLFSMQWLMQQPDVDGPTTGKILLRGYEGGIQPTDDQVFNLAPADGYLVETEMDLGDMQTRTTRRFYFHSSNRLGYGMIEIDYKPESVPPLAIDTRLILSWFGERVLARAIEAEKK